MEFYGIMPVRKMWVKVAVVFFAAIVLYNGVVNHYWFYLPFGIIMVLATFSNRQHVISEEGVDILYTVCGKEFHNMWTWDEIVTIHTDSIKSRPNVELHISKGAISRRFIFSPKDAEQAMDLGKELNPKIYMAEINHSK